MAHTFVYNFDQSLMSAAEIARLNHDMDLRIDNGAYDPAKEAMSVDEQPAVLANWEHTLMESANLKAWNTLLAVRSVVKAMPQGCSCQELEEALAQIERLTQDVVA